MIDGAAAVILFDVRSDEVLRLGEREWAIVAAADGTRDIEGIVVAARREGVRVQTDEAERFLAQLTERGLVVHAPEPETLTPASVPPTDRPVRALPDYALRCDRSGRCCQMYSTVLFARHEAHRAHGVLPDRSFGPVSHDGAFLPVRGSVPGAALAVVANNGACGFLDADGACGIHRAAGPEAKPAGCSLFPAVYIDDGREVRVSIKAECACVLDSLGQSGGDPLVDPAVERASQLAPAIVVSRLPDRIAIDGERVEARDAVVDWTSRWLDAPTPTDVALGCWRLADALSNGLDDSLAAWSEPGDAVDVAEVAPFVEAMARRATVRARVDGRWRSDADRVRRVGAWIARTLVMCKDPVLLRELVAVAAVDAEREAFYVRVAAFGYGPCDEDFGGLQTGLRDLAIKIWVARAMPTFAADVDAADDALTSLEAWLRAYGGWRYVVDVTN